MLYDCLSLPPFAPVHAGRAVGQVLCDVPQYLRPPGHRQRAKPVRHVSSSLETVRESARPPPSTRGRTEDCLTNILPRDVSTLASISLMYFSPVPSWAACTRNESEGWTRTSKPRAVSQSTWIPAASWASLRARSSSRRVSASWNSSVASGSLYAWSGAITSASAVRIVSTRSGSIRD